MGQFLLFSLSAAANPTLIAATTILLLLPDPKRLMIGYLLGAYLVSVTLGCLIVYALRDAGVVDTAKRTVSPAADLAFGAILLLVALVLAGGPGDRLAARRQARHQRHRDRDREPPRWQRALGAGDVRVAFAVGVALTLPGASYLAAMTTLTKLDYPALPTFLCVVLANAMMLLLIELPLLSFQLAPEWTPRAIEGVKGWAGRNLRPIAVWGAAGVGSLLVLRGAIELLA